VPVMAADPADAVRSLPYRREAAVPETLKLPAVASSVRPYLSVAVVPVTANDPEDAVSVWC
jgi:hypothetical protein